MKHVLMEALENAKCFHGVNRKYERRIGSGVSSIEASCGECGAPLFTRVVRVDEDTGAEVVLGKVQIHDRVYEALFTDAGRKMLIVEYLDSEGREPPGWFAAAEDEGVR